MSVARSSFLFAFGTLFSRFGGLIRDMVVVGVFGASIFMDAFLIAFRIPNLLRDLVAEGALGSAFTKVFSSVWEEDRDRAVKLLWQALYLATIASFVICLLGIIFAPQLVHMMTLLSGGDASSEEFRHNAVGLTRLLFPYLGMTMVSAVTMGALHQKGRFFLSAVSPLAFNIGNIIGALAFAPLMVQFAPEWWPELIAEPAISGLALGCLVGGLFYFLWQLQAVSKDFLKDVKGVWREWPWSNDIKNVFAIMIPAAIAASAGPINVFVNTNFATSAGEGAVSWLNYAFRLLQLPIGLFGVAVGAAVLPQLSRSLVRSNSVVDKEVAGHLQSAIELVLWLTVPCMIFILVNSQPVIDLLFQHGRFTSNDSFQTARALYAYSYGMLGYGLIKVLTSFYYAVERTSFAMKIALFSIGVNFFGNYWLVNTYGFVGLAMTSSITLSFNALVLALGLWPHKIRFERKKLLNTALYLIVASVLCMALMQLLDKLLVFFAYGGMNSVKGTALLKVLINGTLTALLFVTFGLIRLGKTPREALSLLRQMRGKRAA